LLLLAWVHRSVLCARFQTGSANA